MPTFTTETGSAINYVRTGPAGAPLVVLAHAIGLDLTFWDQQIAVLSGNYDVVAYDLPGHGLSDPPIGEYSFASAAAVMAEVIRHADAGPAHVVGLSVGGMIAQNFAVAYPDLVRSLSLIDSTSTLPDPGRAAMRARGAEARDEGMAAAVDSTIQRWFTPDFIALRPDVIDRATKAVLANDPGVIALTWDMISTLDINSSLSTITVPTLVLVGELDAGTPPAASQAIADKIAGSELHVIPAASHLAPVEWPDVVNGYLESFLARASQASV
jgi:3-oxoadipate enol-lactonase